MFIKIAPQQAKHTSGYTVQVGGRESVQYLDEGFSAEIESDMLSETVPLYVKTLKILRDGEPPREATSAEKELIITRIENGLAFLGIKSKLIEN